MTEFHSPKMVTAKTARSWVCGGSTNPAGNPISATWKPVKSTTLNDGLPNVTGFDCARGMYPYFTRAVTRSVSVEPSIPDAVTT
jgi:hypothetical protein